MSKKPLPSLLTILVVLFLFLPEFSKAATQSTRSYLRDGSPNMNCWRNEVSSTNGCLPTAHWKPAVTSIPVLPWISSPNLLDSACWRLDFSASSSSPGSSWDRRVLKNSSFHCWGHPENSTHPARVGHRGTWGMKG